MKLQRRTQSRIAFSTFVSLLLVGIVAIAVPQSPSTRTTGPVPADLGAVDNPQQTPRISQRPGSFESRRGFGPRGREPDRSEYPQWTVDPSFQNDVFTFARIQFDSYGGGRGGGHWRNDFPDCDWNFSWRLQQLTSMQVDPNGVVLRLTDEKLFDYPFIYMSNVQRIALDENEVLCLRKYLNNGGFLMADDFWTPAAWRHVRAQMKRVLPNAEPRELTIDHPIFHIVYHLKEIPRIPSIRAWQRGDTFEYWHGDPEGDEDPHFQGYFDNNGRMVAIFCHNNDVGDGFEREGENREYFERYSVKVSYPLGINIVVFALSN